jgi:hypothetical protein
VIDTHEHRLGKMWYDQYLASSARRATGQGWPAQHRQERNLPMHYRTLGQTGLQVSEVGLGAMPFGGMVTQADGTQFGWSGTDDGELIALVHDSEALCVNLLDTAEAYGNGHGEAVSSHHRCT